MTEKKYTVSEVSSQPKRLSEDTEDYVMHIENVECGAVCLSMVLAYYGKWLTSEQLRIDCGVSRDGSNAKNILTAARKYGFESKAYRLEPEVLKEAG